MNSNKRLSPERTHGGAGSLRRLRVSTSTRHGMVTEMHTGSKATRPTTAANARPGSDFTSQRQFSTNNLPIRKPFKPM
jgi:hypothetical protein